MLPGQVFIDARVQFAEQAAKGGMILPPTSHAEFAPRLFWQRVDVPFFLPTKVSKTTVSVRCESGRWLVDCPACSSAQLAARQDPRFFCVSCLNERAGAQWLTVVWPADVPGIEAALRARVTEHANYEPGETVSDLIAQNQIPGVCG